MSKMPLKKANMSTVLNCISAPTGSQSTCYTTKKLVSTYNDAPPQAASFSFIKTPTNSASMATTLRTIIMSFFVTAISLFTITASAQSSSDTATVRTDLQDYPPGATVYITGTGFAAGEEVGLQVVHVGSDPDGTDPEHHQLWHTTADGNGNISSTWTVPVEGDALGASFKLTADGHTSGIVFLSFIPKFW
jgi:hypothetical protein